MMRARGSGRCDGREGRKERERKEATGEVGELVLMLRHVVRGEVSEEAMR